MKNILFHFFIVCVFTICAFVIFSCSKPPQKALALEFWYSLSGVAGEAVKAQVETYCAQNPEVSVNLSYSGSYIDTTTKVSLSLSAKKAPDIVLMAGGPLYTGGQGDFRLDALVNGSEYGRNAVYDVFWEYAKYDGKICAVPYGMSIPVVYYNKEILRVATLDEPKNEPLHWNDFIALLKKAQSTLNSEYRVLEILDSAWIFKTMLNQKTLNTTQNRVLSADFYYDVKAGMDVLLFWKNLVDAGYMNAGRHELAEKNFLAGNALFLISTSNRILRWGSENALDFGVMQLPHFGRSSVNVGGNMVVIFSPDGERFDAAWKLVQYLTSNENQKIFAEQTGYLPVSKNTFLEENTETAHLFNKIAVAEIENGFVYNWQFQTMGVLEAAIKSAVEKLERGIISPEQASREIAAYRDKV